LSLPAGACSLKQYKYCQTAVGKKCEILQHENFGEDSRDKVPLYRKKAKSRGIQEFVPLVQTVTYQYFPLISYVDFTDSENTIIQNSHLTQLLRGPPVA